MGTGRQTKWVPSRREQRFLWWLQLLMRYGIGGGGIVWETVIDRLHNTAALFVFGILATSMDVFSYVAALVKQARSERTAVDHAIRAAREHADDEDEEPAP